MADMTSSDMDKWLAIELMEWHEVSVATPDGQFHVGWDEWRNSRGECKNWHPTKSIEQAFACIEKMRKRGWFLELKDFGEPPDTWRVYLSRFSLEEPNSAVRFNDNLAHALCLTIHATLTGKEE